MKVLLTGSAGQLGQALLDSKPETVELISTTRQELDLSDAEVCRLAIQKYRPDWVLNAGAYTDVDQAESEPELAQAWPPRSRGSCQSQSQAYISAANFDTPTDPRGPSYQWPPKLALLRSKPSSLSVRQSRLGGAVR